MKYINNKVNNPYFNLALEEYIFENVHDDVVIIWKNTNATVVGRYQDAYEVINSKHAPSNAANVVRRMAGGNTEYHGDKNFSFSVITDLRNPGFEECNKFFETISVFIKNNGHEIIDNAHYKKKRDSFNMV